jgi:hypothetical protein
MGRRSNPAATVAPTPMPAVPSQVQARMPAQMAAPRQRPAAMPSSVNSAAANNVFNQASGALTDAMGGARDIMGFQGQQVDTQFGYDPRMVNEQFGYDPQQVAAQQAVGGIQTYMNPYTQQVIDLAGQDIERQRQMTQNQLGAQAQAAGAFGGSRQGVAEAMTNSEFARQMAETTAGLRQQGFQTALGASQQDVANQMAAAFANQDAFGRAQEFGQATGLTAQRANQDAFGRAQEFGQGLTLDAQRANQQAAQQAAQLRLQGSSQLGGFGQTGFNMGQGIIGMQQDFGRQQQMMNQGLLDASRAQYGGFTGAPQSALATRIGAAGAGNMGQRTETQTKNPGLFDYMQLAATAAASDRRLKTNVQSLGQRNGVNIYSWDWTDEGAKIASPDQPTVGVMADELILTHPHLVHRAADGYLRVNYSGL